MKRRANNSISFIFLLNNISNTSSILKKHEIKIMHFKMVIFKRAKRSIVSGPTRYIDPNRGHYGVVSPVNPKSSIFSRFKKWCKKILKK